MRPGQIVKQRTVHTVDNDGNPLSWRYRFAYPRPERPWSTNESGHWSKFDRLKREWRDQTEFVFGTLGLGELPGKWSVEVTIPFERNARRDPHNYVGTVVKAVVDGITRAGIWPDDNPTYVTVREPVLSIDPEDLLVWVDLRPVDAGRRAGH